MFIEDFNHSETCDTVEQLISAMQKRDDKGYNEIGICIDEEEIYYGDQNKETSYSKNCR